MKLTWKDFCRIQNLKKLDFQICDFCHRLNLLDLGWKPWKRYYCRLHDREYLVCPELCLKVCRNIWGCQLFLEAPPTELAFPLRKVAVNQRNYRANYYLCFKELKGAGKHGTVKNRNNPSFWGVESAWKILCLKCVGKRFYKQLGSEKRKTFNKYVRREYE